MMMTHTTDTRMMRLISFGVILVLSTTEASGRKYDCTVEDADLMTAPQKRENDMLDFLFGDLSILCMNTGDSLGFDENGEKLSLEQVNERELEILNEKFTLNDLEGWEDPKSGQRSGFRRKDAVGKYKWGLVKKVKGNGRLSTFFSMKRSWMVKFDADGGDKTIELKRNEWEACSWKDWNRERVQKMDRDGFTQNQTKLRLRKEQLQFLASIRRHAVSPHNDYSIVKEGMIILPSTVEWLSALQSSDGPENFYEIMAITVNGQQPFARYYNTVQQIQYLQHALLRKSTENWKVGLPMNADIDIFPEQIRKWIQIEVHYAEAALDKIVNSRRNTEIAKIHRLRILLKIYEVSEGFGFSKDAQLFDEYSQELLKEENECYEGSPEEKKRAAKIRSELELKVGYELAIKLGRKPEQDLKKYPLAKYVLRHRELDLNREEELVSISKIYSDIGKLALGSGDVKTHTFFIDTILPHHKSLCEKESRMIGSCEFDNSLKIAQILRHSLKEYLLQQQKLVRRMLHKSINSPNNANLSGTDGSSNGGSRSSSPNGMGGSPSTTLGTETI